MPNEFIIKNGFRSQGNSNITGSLSISGSINTTSPISLTGFVSGSVLFTSGSAGVITGSSLLNWDDSNNILKFGTTSNNTSRILFQWPVLSTFPLQNGIHWGDNTSQSYGFIALDRGSGEFRWHGASSYFLTFYSSGAEAMRIPTSRNILIGTTTDAGYKLDVNGDARVQSTLNIQRTPADFLVKFINQSNTTTIGAISHDVAGGIAVMGGSTFYANSITVGINDMISFSTAGTGEKMRISSTGNVGIGTSTPTSRLSVSGSAGTGSAIYAYKSGSTVLDIQGSQGQLFSVVDALSGSLMSVNDVSGLPILEVFSDDRVVMGTYGAPALTVSGSAVTVATASAAPSGAVPEGTFRFATVGGAYFIYAYIGGAWRSGSLS